MPFSGDIPPENTDPWYNPLDSTWAGLTTFVNGLETSLAGKVSASALTTKADLVSGKVPASQLPPLTINETHTAASQAEMLALPAAQGDVAVRTDTGLTYFLSAIPAATLSNWVLMSPSVPTASSTVAGISRFATQGEVTTGTLTNTGITPATLSAALAPIRTAITALQTQTTSTVQVLTWTEGDLTTNGTSYGVYDTAKIFHEFRGARDPMVAGYTLGVWDEWVEPATPPTALPPIKIDDNALTYAGSWSTGTDTENYNSSDHFTSTTGATATYTWTSEVNGQAKLIAKKAAHHGIANISIDGVAAGTADLYAATNTYGVLVYTSPLLSAGSHTLQVAYSGTKNASSSGFVIAIDALELSGAVVGTGGTNPTPGTPPGGALPTGFMYRGTGVNSQKVYIEGSSTPWRGTGVNLPWSQGCNCSPSCGLTPTVAQHATMFAAAKPNSIYRYFLFGGTNLANFDAILNAARPYGHRFIACLSDRANGCGEPYCGPNPQAFYNGGWITGGWRDNHLTPVVMRYKNEPLIGWWEWVNEPHIDQNVRNFFDACGAYVRNTLGDRHLIGTGTTSQYGNTSGMRTLNSSPYIDLCSQHEYDWNQAPSAWTTADRADAAFAGKPWYVGESGIRASQIAAGTPRANQIKAKIDALTPMADCCGFIYWSGAAPGGSWTSDSNRMEIAISGSAEIGVINTEPF